MIPIHSVIWHEARERNPETRQNEPLETMDDPEQVRSYVKAYEWGGPTSALQLHHLREIGRLIRPGDTVLDLACGPGPLLLELAALYPTCHFIGADLSAKMLAHLENETRARSLGNVRMAREDIRKLPSIADGSVDLVISTSALHHLPDETSLAQVFRRIGTLLKRGGGFYLFDFALLRSPRARAIFVAEVSKRAPPLTTRDYDLSLRAAFPLRSVLEIARAELPKPYKVSRSAFVDFFYFLQTSPRAEVSESAGTYIAAIRGNLDIGMRIEHFMLRKLKREHWVAGGRADHCSNPE